MTLDWAREQNDGLRVALERESGTAKLEEAVAVYREALKEWTREGASRDWAMAQHNLGITLLALGIRGSEPAKLIEAVAVFREALKELTRGEVPLHWAMTQHSLGEALSQLALRESGTAKLEEALDAYREALSERARERVPLEWANSIGGEGFALLILTARRRNATIAEIAVSRINTAFETMRNGGDAARAAYYGGLLTTHARLSRSCAGSECCFCRTTLSSSQNQTTTADFSRT